MNIAETGFGGISFVDGQLTHDKDWVHFATTSHLKVQDMLNKFGPKVDGIHVIISTQKWYHVWVRKDNVGCRWEVKTGDFSKVFTSVSSLIKEGYAIPVNFSSTGKTIYWLEKIG